MTHRCKSAIREKPEKLPSDYYVFRLQHFHHQVQIEERLVVRSNFFHQFGPSVHATCACADRTARFDVGGDSFIGEFNGSISVRMGTPKPSAKGEVRVPLSIVGYSTTSDIDGLGRTTLDVAFDRPLRLSELRGSGEKFFPAVQTMRLNIVMTSEAFGQTLLRATTTGTLVNEKCDAWPPAPGSTYVLQKPVTLEAREGRKKVAARLVNVNTGIVSTTINPPELTVGRGLYLYPPGGEAGWVLTEITEKIPIEFRLDSRGRVRVLLLDSRRKELGAVEDVFDKGRQRVELDAPRSSVRTLYYRLEIDGEPRTAPMLLLAK